MRTSDRRCPYCGAELSEGARACRSHALLLRQEEAAQRGSSAAASTVTPPTSTAAPAQRAKA